MQADVSAEIICVGTELLLGEVLNTNAQYLAQEFAQLGIPHYYQTVVGDNPDRIKKVLAIACDRARLLVFTGGLGPTPDDLTTATLADFFEVPLEERPEVLAEITEKFARRGRTMSPSNRKQALFPIGAKVLPNPTGSAPGIIWQPRSGLTILTFPGVPSELKRMWQDTAVPFLRSQGWGQTLIRTRTLRFWGVAESALAERVSDLLALEQPTVAPYASQGEVRLRIAARAASSREAEAMIAPIEQKIRQAGGEDYFGADEDTLASVVGQLLHTTGQTLAVAESCTGGRLGQMLTSIPGSSSYFQGGVIAYSDTVKKSMLDVNAADLAEHGAVSGLVAQQMAVGVQMRLGTTWGLSITGIAGPGGGSREKPVGLVYIGLAGPKLGAVESFMYQFGSDRQRSLIQHLSACNALDRLRRRLISLSS